MTFGLVGQVFFLQRQTRKEMMFPSMAGECSSCSQLGHDRNLGRLRIEELQKFWMLGSS
jgi:hypothetical protein